MDGKVIKKLVLANEYRWLTVGEVLDKVDNIAKGLYEIGIRPGDRVVIYADTQSDWFFCCLAIAKLNATLVTLYSNLGDSGVMYGMNQTKAKYVITTEELMNKLLTYGNKVPNLKNMVYFESKCPNLKAQPIKPADSSIRIFSLNEIEASGSRIAEHKFEFPQPDDIALIMYTSGTTSLPKAVMITHQQLMANMKGMTVAAEENRFDLPTQVLGSFLPLAHIFGYVFNIYMFISEFCLNF